MSEVASAKASGAGAVLRNTSETLDRRVDITPDLPADESAAYPLAREGGAGVGPTPEGKAPAKLARDSSEGKAP